MTHQELSPQEVRELAAEAVCDPRTVRAYLREPGKVKSTSRKRIERALARMERVGAPEHWASRRVTP